MKVTSRTLLRKGSDIAQNMATPILNEMDAAKKRPVNSKLLQEAKKSKISAKGIGKMRDKQGFQLKIQDVNGSRNKQTDPDYDVKIEGPLRKIVPYFFTYKTFCKERWRDRKLIDIFIDEFRDRSPEYYRKTIAAGKVYLNDSVADLDSVVRNGDLITHEIHRHEPSVTSRLIKTVFEDDDLLVIDKPSGIPVHPTGRYRFNTVTKILEKERGYTVHPCNRLDRLTSGLMFLAKNPRGADRMADQMKAREVSKEYVARVVGEFPAGLIVVDKPLRTVNPKVGLNVTCKITDEGAKEARTSFERISFDGKTSIVRCKPFTGRTHQIRVHLQHLGHPIANDPIYSNPNIWGPSLGKDYEGDFSDVIRSLDLVGKTESAESWMHPDSFGEVLLGQQCEICDTELYSDPGPNDLDLWLHAYRYESTELDSDGKKLWSYRTDFPDWAIEPHRKYMELAIDEARNCGETQTAFNVGALLVNGTDILSTGYSRELPGNTHAEQCALDKYFTKSEGAKLPDGTIIYTTMEPCSLRLSGNLPCVDRIIQTTGAIKTVFVGVMEPDIFVKNNTSYHKLSQYGIDYILIPGYEEECLKVACKGHDKTQN
ncbi:Rib2/Pus9 [Kluyveromyces lactis]|nr:Rib2/Pus9 [Kluyveromyces lactis]